MLTSPLKRNVLPGCALALAMLTSAPAHALVWPDVPDRIERDLGGPDANTRRIAAREISQLGAARGAPLVLRALSDPDDEVRMAGADSAIRLRVAAATDLVLPWLLAKDPRPRKKACEVARALPAAHAVGPLSRALGDPDQEVRGVAAEALGYQASPDAVAPLLGKLDDQTPAVRVQIVAALARLADVRAVVPLVGKARDSSPEVRQAVARALGELGDPRAAQALMSQLQDVSPDVKREALTALGLLKVEDAVDAIAPLLSDRVPALREEAFDALGHIASDNAVRALVAALGTGDDAGGGLERTPVRDALVRLGPAALPQLRAVLEGQPNPQVATSAAWVLGDMKAKAMAPVLVAAMRRGALPTAAALNALAGAGTPESVAVVLEFVDDPSAIVRAEAIRAANALLDPAHPDGRAVEPLAAALRDTHPSPAERADLAALLGRTGAPRAAAVLIDLASTHDRVLRLAAIDALGMLGPAPGTGSGASDDALLGVLADADAQARLHAAIALSESGGVRAQAELLKKLEGDEEIDRSVLLTALAGVASRVGTDAVVSRLARALDLSAGPERDAILQAIGRAPVASSTSLLSSIAKSGDVDDRRTIATLLAAQADRDPTKAAALALARTLLDDPDAGVRAQAAWSLGALGDAQSVALLDAVVRAPEIDAAVDAAGAIGRIAARLRSPDLATRALCPRLADARPYVRANALAALAIAGARCGDGSPERRVLAEDVSDAARAAAALAVRRDPSSDDRRALDKCAATDHSGTVAHRCRAAPHAHARSAPVEVYVVGEATSTPHARSAYALELADGLLHVGTSDRRGAMFEPAAPNGEITLR